MALDDVYTEVLGEHSRNPDHKHHWLVLLVP